MATATEDSFSPKDSLPVFKYGKQQDFHRGDVILEEDFWLWTFESQMDAQDICGYCFSRNNLFANLKRCSMCKTVHYCSPACQKADWKARHKRECKLMQIAIENFRRPTDVVFDAPLMLLHMASSVLTAAAASSNNNSDKSCLSSQLILDAYNRMPVHDIPAANLNRVNSPAIGEPIKFDMANNNIQKRIQPALVAFHNYNKLTEQSPTKSGLDRFFCLGVGVCFEMSRFAHSCRANCVAINDGRKVRMVALEDIPTLDDVRLSRIALEDWYVMPTSSRQDLVKGHFDYLCACRRCTEGDERDATMFALRCPRSVGDAEACTGIALGIRQEDFSSQKSLMGQRKITASKSDRKRAAEAAALRVRCNKCDAHYDRMRIEKILSCLYELQYFAENMYAVPPVPVPADADRDAKLYLMPTCSPYKFYERGKITQKMNMNRFSKDEFHDPNITADLVQLKDLAMRRWCDALLTELEDCSMSIIRMLRLLGTLPACVPYTKNVQTKRKQEAVCRMIRQRLSELLTKEQAAFIPCIGMGDN